MIKRSTQLTRLRRLYETRERSAWSTVQKQQQAVAVITNERDAVQSAIDKLGQQLSQLSKARNDADSITVVVLQEEAALRVFYERELHKQHSKLELADKEHDQAVAGLNAKRDRWRKQRIHIDALAQLESCHSRQDSLQSAREIVRELDDFVASTQRSLTHA